MRDLLLLTHFTGVVVGAGVGFSIFVIGFLSKSFPFESRSKVLVSLYPLRYISYIGLALLIISGVQLLQGYWSVLSLSPLLHVKLFSVLIIFLLSIFGFYQMKTTTEENATLKLKKLGVAGKASFALSIVVISCATYTFH